MIPVRRTILVYNRNTRRYERSREDVYDGTMAVPYSPDQYVGSKKYATERGFRNAMQKEYEGKLEDVRSVEEAGDFEDGTIVLDWTKTNEGNQARATFDYRYTDPNGNLMYRRVTSPRTYGYDKESSAVSDVLDQSPEFRKSFYDQLDNGKDFSVIRRGKGYAPKFEGGIGMSTYRGDLPKAGYVLEDVAHNPKTDVYAIRRAKVKNMAKKAKSNSKVGWDKITGRRPY